MEVANTLAYYNMATITTVRSFIVQAPQTLISSKLINGPNKLECWSLARQIERKSNDVKLFTIVKLQKHFDIEKNVKFYKLISPNVLSEMIFEAKKIFQSLIISFII